ncbi:sodium:calcium antiporter [Aminobacter aminovorans]|jgi:cation:H+ antiporter|uniref:Cation transporter n=1 Tax=Aminobacter aminovorans TaxID=83263 RepID=A0AAC8YVV4_AMIAI|nr:sodium:calcium antiporter [Aminobacter aminovorans]AMS44974.1 cation transporter [Aminobacter aminovorans]MBB3709772.1 cation:H+ antiporter [Aminobacter aminovorans]
MTAAPLLPWAEFVACATLIAIAGPLLVRYGDAIARLTGLSRSWIGLALLATATSLPELFTGISAVTLADAPNIAVGDALGSCIFNLAMLVALDALTPDPPIYRRIDQGHILTAGFGIVMVGIVGAILLASRTELDFRILHVSAYTPLLPGLYLIALRAAFLYEPRVLAKTPEDARHSKISIRAAVLRYLLTAAVIVVAGTWLPFIGVEIAETMGWQTTFVGTLLIAAVTSLPELAVTIAAIRMGAPDMAIANLLGSNLFNILVLAVDDVAYLEGPIFAAASPSHAVSAFGTVIMTGIFIIALIYRPEERLLGAIGWVSVSLVAVYVLVAYASLLLGQ